MRMTKYNTLSYIVFIISLLPDPGVITRPQGSAGYSNLHRLHSSLLSTEEGSPYQTELHALPRGYEPHSRSSLKTVPGAARKGAQDQLVFFAVVRLVSSMCQSRGTD